MNLKLSPNLLIQKAILKQESGNLTILLLPKFLDLKLLLANRKMTKWHDYQKPLADTCTMNTMFLLAT